jgi:plasmid stabilization system protein ParE
MPRRVIFAPRALRQFNAQLAYLADRNPVAGRRLISRIDAARRQLADFPRNAPRAAAPGARRLIVAPHVLTYREHGCVIEIIDSVTVGRRPISRPQSQNQETNMTEKSRNDDLARSTTAQRALAELFLGKSPEEWRAEYAEAFDWGQDIGREAIEE